MKVPPRHSRLQLLVNIVVVLIILVYERNIQYFYVVPVACVVITRSLLVGVLRVVRNEGVDGVFEKWGELIG